MNKIEKKEEVSNKYEWSDDFLNQMANAKIFPSDSFKTEEIKPILARFFNFYFSGKISPDCTVPCTIYSAIALLNVPHSKGYLKVFAKKNDTKKEKKLTFFDVHVHTDREYFEQSNDLSQELFQNEIWKILISWDYSTTKEQATLMRLAAFLALKFCIVASKNKSQTLSSFFKYSNKLRETLSKLVGWEMNRNYSVPNPKGIDMFIELLSNDNNIRLSLRYLFAIVVQKWINIVRMNPKGNRISSLLMESLLDAAAGNGIALITLITTVIFYLNCTYEQIMNVLKTETKCFSKYEKSFQRLEEFQKKFVSESNPELSYPWGRIIKPSFLIEYAGTNNIYLCSVFATIIEKYEGQTVWNTSWAHKKDFDYKEPRKVGIRIHDRLLSKLRKC
ncbi:uncharacterized protein LOC122512840 [Leptopilina heterotoma]|uniref:uncharacterized protein LOC122512840 n=1 Tax=Leptopilina heterotoma TaxID=63436 RepID=UPI001CA9A736|nr:uncharacterized protein LOC122512840 [Leptopilina heterotoma]